MTESTAIEQEELPCIWMLAGVLSYRLCDRQYDCENCELYHALQGGESARHEERGPFSGADSGGHASLSEIEDRVNSYICRLASGCELHLDRPYCPCYFWLRRTQADRVLLGLDGHLLKLLYPVEDITLPHVGVLVKRGDTCGWITRGRMAVPLTAPLTGEVEAVNEPYLKKVLATGGADGAEDWVLGLTADEHIDAVPGLYRSEQTLTWYLRKIQLIKRYLREAAATDVDELVGVTLDDGGEPNLDLEKVLGRERFEALVVELFNIQI